MLSVVLVCEITDPLAATVWDAFDNAKSAALAAFEACARLAFVFWFA